MAFVEIKENLTIIRREVSLAPNDHILAVFVEVAREFCDFTRAMQYEAPTLTITEDQSDYAIAVQPVDPVAIPKVYMLEPIAIEAMTVDDFPCYPKSVAWLDQNIPSWRTRDTDDFRYFTTINRGYFTFPCVPTKDGTDDGVKYRVSQRPKLDCTELDEDFLAEWLEVLSNGTKARLMMEEGKSWYKPKRGDQLEKYYRHGRGEARIRVNKSHGNTTERVTAPRFA